jgi:hypothetical protein
VEPRGRNGVQNSHPQTHGKTARTRQTVADACEQSPRRAHGKEGVDGSSPSEGFAFFLAQRLLFMISVAAGSDRSEHVVEVVRNRGGELSDSLNALRFVWLIGSSLSSTALQTQVPVERHATPSPCEGAALVSRAFLALVVQVGSQTELARSESDAKRGGCGRRPQPPRRLLQRRQAGAQPPFATTDCSCCGVTKPRVTLLRLESNPTIWKPLKTLWYLLKSSFPAAPW